MRLGGTFAGAYAILNITAHVRDSNFCDRVAHLLSPSFSLKAAKCGRLRDDAERHRTFSIGKGPLSRILPCTALSAIQTALQHDGGATRRYSFTLAVIAALLSNSPWKERSVELDSYLLGNLFGNLPSSSVPGESKTILGAPFPRARGNLLSFFGQSG